MTDGQRDPIGEWANVSARAARDRAPRAPADRSAPTGHGGGARSPDDLRRRHRRGARPAPSPGPAADEPVRASKEDGTLRLSLTTPSGIYRPDDAIEPLATISYLGPTAETMIYTGDPAVVFAIQELGGGRRMDWSQNLPCLNTIVDQAEPLTFPFAKSGVMTSFDAAWYADPVLRLPVGIWRIRAVLDAETTNGAGGCGGVPHRFEVDNVIQVVDEPTP